MAVRRRGAAALLCVLAPIQPVSPASTGEAVGALGQKFVVFN